MSWKEYFEKIKGRAVRPMLKKALAEFESSFGSEVPHILRDAPEFPHALRERRAIDLGCGPGTDTLYLLQQGWKVTAVEKEPEGLKYLQSTLSQELAKNLTVIESSFENLKALPKADLIYASLSLPFCSKEAFPQFWKVIETSFSDHCVFAANFFGPEDDWVKADRVTGHTEEEIREMLTGFSKVKIETYKQVGPTALEGDKFWHLFEVIACR